MKRLTGRRRLLSAVVVAAALAGLAAGLLVGHGNSANARPKGPVIVARGNFHAFRTVTWSTTGTASVVREPNGDLRLRLSSDFKTTRAPDLAVYLAKFRGQQKVYWKQVAPLRSWSGAQTYPVSSDAVSTPGLEIAINCGECNQINAVAPLAPVTRS